MDQDSFQERQAEFAALTQNVKSRMGCATTVMACAGVLFATYVGFQFGRANMKPDTVGVGGFFFGNISAKEGQITVPLGTINLGDTPVSAPETKPTPKPAAKPKPAPKPPEVSAQSVDELPLHEKLIQVKNGMSYNQVRDLLGAPLKSARLYDDMNGAPAPPDFKVYVWGSSPQALIVFQSGLVIHKEIRN